MLLLELVKVVNDDTDEQVHDEKRAEHDEEHEVEQRPHALLSSRLLIELN